MKAIAVLLLGLFVCPALASDTHGTVCVAPIPPGAPRAADIPEHVCRSGKLSYRIDSRPATGWPHRASFELEDIDITASSFFAMASRSSHSVSASIRTNRPIFAFSSTISIRPRSFGSVNSRHGVSANSANRVQIIQTNVNRVFAHYTVSLCALLIPGKGRFE